MNERVRIINPHSKRTYFVRPVKNENFEYEQCSESNSKGTFTLRKEISESGLYHGQYFESEKENVFKATFVVTEGDLTVELPLVEKSKEDEWINLPEQYYDYNFYIDWGDDSPIQHITKWDDPNRIHEYPSEGEYQITVTGTMQMWRYLIVFGWSTNGTPQHLKSIDQTGAGFCDNVVAFSGMFAYCENLESVPELDTSSGVFFNSMFFECISLINVHLPDTSSGVNFMAMFYECISLINVHLPDTSSGVVFRTMFYECVSLSNVHLPDTSSGVSFASMFWGCISLSNVYLPDTSSGDDFYDMFAGCISLINVHLPDTSSGECFHTMFAGCISLINVHLPDTSSGAHFFGMFADCISLSNVSLSDVSNGSGNLKYVGMFFNCTSLASVSMPGINGNISFADCPLPTIAAREDIYENSLTEVGAPGSDTYTITMPCPDVGEDDRIAQDKGWLVQRQVDPLITR